MHAHFHMCGEMRQTVYKAAVISLGKCCRRNGCLRQEDELGACASSSQDLDTLHSVTLQLQPHFVESDIVVPMLNHAMLCNAALCHKSTMPHRGLHTFTYHLQCATHSTTMHCLLCSRTPCCIPIQDETAHSAATYRTSDTT